MADENRTQDTPNMSGNGSNNNKDGNNGNGVFADHNYGTKAEGGNTANYDSEGNLDVNDAGGNVDGGQAHDDKNGGGDVIGRRGGGYGEASGLGKIPSDPVDHQPHGQESDKDTGRGTHAGGLGDSHSGFLGNHNGNDGTGGGKSSGSAGHGGNPDDRKNSSGDASKDDVDNTSIAGRGGKH